MNQTTIVVPALPQLLRVVGVIILALGIYDSAASLYYVGSSCDGDCKFLAAQYGSIAAGFGLALFGCFSLFAFASGLEYLLEGRHLAGGSSRKCPFCAETIKSGATVCRYCGRALSEVPLRDT
jgi:hypothetical protein